MAKHILYTTRPTYQRRKDYCGWCRTTFHPSIVDLVDCPKCGALVGSWCCTPNGSQSGETHAARRDLAMEKGVLGECPRTYQ